MTNYTWDDGGESDLLAKPEQNHQTNSEAWFEARFMPFATQKTMPTTLSNYATKLGGESGIRTRETV